jgi:hypothetical protein
MCFASASSVSASRCATRDDPALAERLRVLGDPALSDAEKIRSYRRDAASEAGVDTFFASLDDKVADESVDALTRDTLRWYVHEERDSRAPPPRRLRAGG